MTGQDFRKLADEKCNQYTVVCWGSGGCFERLFKSINELYCLKYVIDKNPNKWNTEVKPGVKCISPMELKPQEKLLVIICVESDAVCKEIEQELKEKGIYDYIWAIEWITEYLKLKRRKSLEKCLDKDVLTNKSVTDLDRDNLSFVVTGKMDYSGEYTADKSIGSIKTFFPKATIILVTWEGENVEPVKNLCEKIIFLKEPEAKGNYNNEKWTGKHRQNTINKQQLCVNTGLKEVTTQYAIRLRTDFVLENDNFFELYKENVEKYIKRDSNYLIFKDRVLVSQAFMYDPALFEGAYSYMVSDCFAFGLTEDLLKLWDGHEEPDDEMNYFMNGNHGELFNPAVFSTRYNAEQCFFINCVKKSGLNVELPSYYYDQNAKAEKDYYKVLSSNVFVGTEKELGLKSKFNEYDMRCFLGSTDLADLYNMCF